jgi:hypothetical protein
MPKRFALVFSTAFCAFLAAVPASAVSLRNNDAFVGYSRLGHEAFNASAGGLNGWEAALHIHLHPFLGVEGDVAHYGLGAAEVVPRTTTVLIGPRVSVKALGINLFAHGMVGGEHSANSGNASVHISRGALAYAAGGGIDLPILPFFAWRFGLDYIGSTESPGGGRPARFNTGLVFRF